MAQLHRTESQAAKEAGRLQEDLASNAAAAESSRLELEDRIATVSVERDRYRDGLAAKDQALQQSMQEKTTTETALKHVLALICYST